MNAPVPVLPPCQLPLPPAREAFVGTPAETRKAMRGGTHRERTLFETVALAERSRSVAGITRVAEITGLDRLKIPAYNTIRPAAADETITVTGGKGVTPQAARASGLLEAIERYCAERNGRHGPRGTVEQARAWGPIVHPRELILARKHRFTSDASLEWWPARELGEGGDVVWVPAVAAIMPHTEEPYLITSTTNGLASGNSRTEATLHAVLELVERDLMAFAQGDPRRGAVLDLDAIEAQPLRGLIDAYAEAQIDIRVRVFTNAIGIPVFHAIIDDPLRADPMLINGGSGCHLDPAVGLCRALTEAALSRATVLSGAREDLDVHLGSREGSYEDARTRAAAWLGDEGRRTRLDAFEDQSADSTAQDLRTVQERLRAADLERVLAVDLTLPDLPFSVVRAVVPGLELLRNDLRIGRRLLRYAKGQTDA
ncbi:MAG: YcaO-like family protein [Myxococcota bacterium]